MLICFNFIYLVILLLKYLCLSDVLCLFKHYLFFIFTPSCAALIATIYLEALCYSILINLSSNIAEHKDYSELLIHFLITSNFFYPILTILKIPVDVKRTLDTSFCILTTGHPSSNNVSSLNRPSPSSSSPWG